MTTRDRRRRWAHLVSLWLLAFSFSLQASARVFDFNRESFAFYFGGSFGNSNAGNGAYGLSSGNQMTFDRSVQSTASGEFGFVFSATRFNLRLTAEYLMPRDQVGVNGSDSAGNQLFSLHSTLSALIPEVNIELMPYRGHSSRVLLGLGYGYAMVNLNNQYTMTQAGESELGVGSFTESATATTSMYQGYVGWEFLFTDTVTATIDAGYRYLMVPGFQATQTVNAISGTENQGSNLINMDGSGRAINLGGGFVGINFRFYL